MAQETTLYIERFIVFQRIIHLTIIISFLTLVLTKIALKFAPEPWAQTIAYFGGGFVVLGALHRFMAIITFFYFFLTMILLHTQWLTSGKSLLGFIFTIHFYNTHLRPQKWPLDPVIFVGNMTVQELQHERPREYEQFVKSGELDKLTSDQAPEGWLIKFSYIFGLFVLPPVVS